MILKHWILALCSLCLIGCTTIPTDVWDAVKDAIEDIKPDPTPDDPIVTPDPPPVVVPPSTDLPQNPRTGKNKSGSISEYFSAKAKSYDSSYRVSWPSHFSDHMKIGSGSYTMVEGVRLTYRNQDKDYGANRPKYEIPQREINLDRALLYVLHAKDGTPVGWIRTGLTGGKYLPDQAAGEDADEPPPSVVTPDQPAPPAAGDQFAYVPGDGSTRIHIPARFKPWQLHIFSRRKHAHLYGPDKSGGLDYVIGQSGAALKAASVAAGDDGSLLIFVNTSGEGTGGLANAGWRILDPNKAVYGDGSRLKPGENK